MGTIPHRINGGGKGKGDLVEEGIEHIRESGRMKKKKTEKNGGGVTEKDARWS